LPELYGDVWEIEDKMVYNRKPFFARIAGDISHVSNTMYYTWGRQLLSYGGYWTFYEKMLWHEVTNATERTLKKFIINMSKGLKTVVGTLWYTFKVYSDWEELTVPFRLHSLNLETEAYPVDGGIVEEVLIHAETPPRLDERIKFITMRVIPDLTYSRNQIISFKVGPLLVDKEIDIKPLGFALYERLR